MEESTAIKGMVKYITRLQNRGKASSIHPLCVLYILRIISRQRWLLVICVFALTKHLHWINGTLSNCIWRDCWSYSNPNNWRKRCMEYLQYLTPTFSLALKKDFKSSKDNINYMGNTNLFKESLHSLLIYSWTMVWLGFKEP